MWDKKQTAIFFPIFIHLLDYILGIKTVCQFNAIHVPDNYVKK